MKADHAVAVIGGGQAGLAVAYYLRRAGLDFRVFDAGDRPGGAWGHGWDSLRLFSPAAYSSLPGWPMPPAERDGYPTRDEVIDYLSRYEARYGLPVERPKAVAAVERDGAHLRLRFADGEIRTAQAVVSATGTWGAPVVPDYPGRDAFGGVQLHSARYRSPEPFRGQRVLVVGGGNSGAQILAELSLVADATWVTLDDPVFLPDDVDGRVLFERASARIRGDFSEAATTTLGDIVMVPAVKQARDRGVLKAVRPFERFTERGVAWSDGTTSAVDAVVWCTGFLPATGHLRPLGPGAAALARRLRQLDRRRLGDADRRRPHCPRPRPAGRGGPCPVPGGCGPAGLSALRRAELPATPAQRMMAQGAARQRAPAGG